MAKTDKMIKTPPTPTPSRKPVPKELGVAKAGGKPASVAKSAVKKAPARGK